MNKFIAFVRESIDEIRTKVTWPKYRDLQQSSILVLVASLIFALVIGLIDYGFQNIMELYYKNI